MELKKLESINQISKEQWRAIESPDFPFSDYEYLIALENSNSACSETGWKPIYSTYWEEGNLIAANFAYEKSHSYGEYIFDWSWAQAYHENGIEYYPKITSSVPFTPATGPKILIKEGYDQTGILRKFAEDLEYISSSSSASGAHLLFNTKEEYDFFKSKKNWIVRDSFQYHWFNHNYSNFDDFLNALKSKRKKEVRRERRNISDNLKVISLQGNEINEEHLSVIYQFYLTTILKKYSHAYLTEDFFQLIGQSMKDRILIFLAEENGKYVAGSIFFHKGKKLFGRYWGCLKEYQNLHFELCYYLGIEFAIQNKMELFEAGAQGGHKINRGFIPNLTYSSHFIADPRFAAAIKRFCNEESEMLRKEIISFEKNTPYKISA